MPEILEIEMYRRGAEPVVGRRITEVSAPDAWYLKGADAAEVRAALVGARIERLDRVGKLMLVETDQVVLGLRFGMTGRLVIDATPVIDALEYSSSRLDPGWDRFALGFAEVGSLVMNDPRRLGGVILEPDKGALGIDAWAVDAAGLAEVLAGSRAACKARLLDQARLAGLGNLLVDELCWRVGVDPARSCDRLTGDEIVGLAAAIGPMLDELYGRGGSHLGDHVSERQVEGRCPRDGAEMRHATVGGRSTWWCAHHQV